MVRIPHVEITAESGATIPEDILRNLTMLFATRKGEQALDRKLGIAWEAVDRPPHEAERLIRLDVMEQVRLADERCRPVSVNFSYGETSEALSGILGVKVVIAV